MPYIIINYDEPFYECTEVVRDEEGKVLLFSEEEEALRYAAEELNFSWKAVKI